MLRLTCKWLVFEPTKLISGPEAQKRIAQLTGQSVDVISDVLCVGICSTFDFPFVEVSSGDTKALTDG